MTLPSRAHVITGGYPPGAAAGHDHDYARLRLLELLRDAEIRASVANDFADIGKWLDISRLLITYVAGPYPDDEQDRLLRGWIAARHDFVRNVHLQAPLVIARGEMEMAEPAPPDDPPSPDEPGEPGEPPSPDPTIAD